MKGSMYSANAWSYVHLGDGLAIRDAVRRIGSAGYDGFDLLYGADAYPRVGRDIRLADIADIKKIAADSGMKIASVVLVSFGLGDPDDCLRQLDEGIALAKALGAGRINLLPRKAGITQEEGFARLEKVWAAKARQIHDSNLVVSAENHIWFEQADDDIFLIRNTDDFIRMNRLLGGQIRIKFDPAWLLKAGDEPVPSFRRCLPFVDILDAKDYADGRFVPPGEGLVDFNGLAAAMNGAGRPIDIAVEVEEHHFCEPPLTDPDTIDELNRTDLRYFKAIFG